MNWSLSRSRECLSVWGLIVMDGNDLVCAMGASPLAKERAEKIIRAVNSHDDLVAALQGLLDCPDLNLDELDPITRDALDVAFTVMAKAKGEST